MQDQRDSPRSRDVVAWRRCTPSDGREAPHLAGSADHHVARGDGVGLAAPPRRGAGICGTGTDEIGLACARMMLCRAVSGQQSHGLLNRDKAFELGVHSEIKGVGLVAARQARTRKRFRLGHGILRTRLLCDQRVAQRNESVWVPSPSPRPLSRWTLDEPGTFCSCDVAIEPGRARTRLPIRSVTRKRFMR